jgi:hypothetical protein
MRKLVYHLYPNLHTVSFLHILIQSYGCTLRKSICTVLYKAISKREHFSFESRSIQRKPDFHWFLTIYRGPGFLAVVWFGSSFTPSPPPPSESSTGDWRGLEGGGGPGGEGTKSYAGEKAWSSINYSILSDFYYIVYSLSWIKHIVDLPNSH